MYLHEPSAQDKHGVEEDEYTSSPARYALRQHEAGDHRCGDDGKWQVEREHGAINRYRAHQRDNPGIALEERQDGAQDIPKKPSPAIILPAEMARSGLRQETLPSTSVAPRFPTP